MIKFKSLKKNKQFLNILKKKKINTKYFIIYFDKTSTNTEKSSHKYLNISFVMKKKIGNAVKRNKIKRRLRNIVNEAVKKVTLKFSYSYLVIAKSTMLNNEYKNIKETLFQDLEKIK